MKHPCLSIGILCCLLVGCGAETEQISELTSAEETTVSITETTAAEADVTTVTAVTTETLSAATTAVTTTHAAETVSPYARTIPASPDAPAAAPPSRTTEPDRQQQPQAQNNTPPAQPARDNAQPSRNTAQPAQQDRSADQAAARADYDRLSGEVAAAQANADAAAQRCNAARDTYNAAVQQRDQYRNQNQQSVDQFSLGSFGFFSYVGAQSALDALNNAQYASFTVRGDANDATSLTNMKNSFAWMRKCNQLRANEGLAPLRVTDRLMAIAQSDLNWSDANINHSCQFNVGENLAWNYSDPFTGWYDAEKPTRGGHYLNIINSGYTTTGFAVCTAGRSRMYSVSHGQVFDFNGSDASYTVDEYESRFDAYYNTMIAVQQQMTALDQAAANAENDLNARNAQLADANAVLAQKQQELQAAAARLQ